MALVRLAVLGDPLAYTRSPDLHRAGLAALGMECESVALPTPAESLGARLAELAAGGYLGVNVTHPHKEAVMAHARRHSEAARRGRSANTIGLAADGWWADTTDGLGFVDLLRTLGRDPAAERVVLFGSGGASRSLALALLDAGAAVSAITRDPARAADSWSEIPGARLERAEAKTTHLVGATLIVNGTPVSAADAPVAPEETPPGALLVDLTYGPEPTRWVSAARAAGRDAIDGLGLLVHQARRSIELWTGRAPAIEPLARAVGWRQ